MKSRLQASWTMFTHFFLFSCFKVHRKVRYNSEMAHHSLQCLAQLASLNGPVFPDDKARAQYLDHFLQAFLACLTE